MKIILAFCIIVFGFIAAAQSPEYVGEYYCKNDNTSMQQLYTLILKENGTFEFEQYWKEKIVNRWRSDGSGESNGYEKAKGSWVFKDGVILFRTNRETDIDQNYRLNFNDTKARLENKTSLVLFTSGIFWLENLMLEKKVD